MSVCKKEATSRGLCAAHYVFARGLVHKGETTWERLEKEGKVAPRQRASSTTAAAREFFLEGHAV